MLHKRSLLKIDFGGFIVFLVFFVTAIDKPPHSDAGADVFLQQPVSSAVLNGNASYDDNGIVSYQWMRLLEDRDLGLDMRVNITLECNVM